MASGDDKPDKQPRQPHNLMVNIFLTFRNNFNVSMGHGRDSTRKWFTLDLIFVQDKTIVKNTNDSPGTLYRINN
jgi:hypothetical protein